MIIDPDHQEMHVDNSENTAGSLILFSQDRESIQFRNNSFSSENHQYSVSYD